MALTKTKASAEIEEERSLSDTAKNLVQGRVLPQFNNGEESDAAEEPAVLAEVSEKTPVNNNPPETKRKPEPKTRRATKTKGERESTDEKNDNQTLRPVPAKEVAELYSSLAGSSKDQAAEMYASVLRFRKDSAANRALFSRRTATQTKSRPLTGRLSEKAYSYLLLMSYDSNRKINDCLNLLLEKLHDEDMESVL